MAAPGPSGFKPSQVRSKEVPPGRRAAGTRVSNPHRYGQKAGLVATSTLGTERFKPS